MFTYNKKRVKRGNLSLTLVMLVFMISVVSVTAATVLEGIKYENRTVKQIQERYDSISISELAGYKAMSLIDGCIYEETDMSEIEDEVKNYLSTNNKNFNQVQLIDKLEDSGQILLKIKTDAEKDITIKVSGIDLVELETETDESEDMGADDEEDTEEEIKREINCDGCSVERLVHYE